MRSIITSALTVATAMLPLMAHAGDQLNYSYIDAAYINTDIDNFDKDVDGFALRGSLEVTDQVFLFAGYSDQSTSIFGEDLDYQQMTVGGGYAWPVTQTADLYGRLGYVKDEVDYAGFNADDDGYSLGVGMRGRVAQQFELEGALNYVDLADSGDDTSLGLGARWFFTPQFVAGVEADIGDNATTYGLGVRWHWGN